jgi:outer membrane protein W
MRTNAIRTVILTAALAALASGASAQGNWQPGDFGALRFRVGLVEPAADSVYWDDVFTVFTGSASDFRDLGFGVDYLWRTSMNSGLVFGTDFYSGSATQAYRDYVDAQGWDISHTTSLDTWDLSLAYQYRFGRRPQAVVPYVGIGGGFLNWKLRESGYFIDFGDPDLPIVPGDYRASGWTWEALGLVGVDLPLSFRWSVFVEGRYRYSEDELGDDFAGFGTIDLSAYEVAIGFAWLF